MSMVSSSSPEPSIEDHPETSAFVSTNDLLLLPDLKVPPKEIVQDEAIRFTPACHEQGTVDFIHSSNQGFTLPALFMFYLFDKQN